MCLIIINFTSYKIYRELEKQLKEKSQDLSAEKTIETAKTIYSIKTIAPNTQEVITKTLILNEEQKI